MTVTIEKLSAAELAAEKALRRESKLSFEQRTAVAVYRILVDSRLVAHLHYQGSWRKSARHWHLQGLDPHDAEVRHLDGRKIEHVEQWYRDHYLLKPELWPDPEQLVEKTRLFKEAAETRRLERAEADRLATERRRQAAEEKIARATRIREAMELLRQFAITPQIEPDLFIAVELAIECMREVANR